MAEFRGACEKSERETLSGKYGIKKESFVVKNRSDEEKTGLKRGRYVTLNRKNVYAESDDEKIYFERCVAKAIREEIDFSGVRNDYVALVLGLGNGYMTADALGKRVCDGILTTRKTCSSGDKIKKVCAFAVGVSGVTGIDSFEVAKGLVNEVRPDFIICVDSLCAFRTDRIGRSYQISSAGIRAGSGTGAKTENRLDFSTLGVPVIAVGVPFVISARRLIYDVSLGESGFDPVSPEEDMFVTFRDADVILKECASVLSAAVNLALQPEFGIGDVLALTD